MDWTVIIGLIDKYGLPLAEYLWQKWSSKAVPTQADWDQLKAIAANTAKTKMTQALLDNGIDPNSPQGQALLALVS